VIVGARVGDVARAHLEGCGLSVDASLAEAHDRVGTSSDHPDANRLAAGRCIVGIDAEGGERRIERAFKGRHQRSTIQARA
jgi:hypothetical protein